MVRASDATGAALPTLAMRPFLTVNVVATCPRPSTNLPLTSTRSPGPLVCAAAVDMPAIARPLVRATAPAAACFISSRRESFREHIARITPQLACVGERRPACGWPLVPAKGERCHYHQHKRV